MKDDKNLLKRTTFKKHDDERISRATSIAMMSFKGGTGKTSLTAGLGLTLVRKGYDVLWIDNDAQSNLTQRIGWTTGQHKSQYRVPNLLKVGDVALGDESGINAVLQVPLNINYSFFYKERGLGDYGKGKLGIIGGSNFASIEASSLNDKYKKDRTAFEYPSVPAFYNSAIGVYKQYFDYILFDTAPSMEGNLLNILTVLAADEVVTPVDGLEAANGISNMISFVQGHTMNSLSEYGVKKPAPNMTFAMVKYQRDSKTKIDGLEEVIEGGILGENEVFRLLKTVLGNFVCDKGVQERQALRQTLSGFSANDYSKLSIEIIQKLQEKRPNIHDIWNTEKRSLLEAGLQEIELKNLVKRPILKGCNFK